MVCYGVIDNWFRGWRWRRWCDSSGRGDGGYGGGFGIDDDDDFGFFKLL